MSADSFSQTPSDDECLQQALRALQAVSKEKLTTETSQEVQSALSSLQARQDEMDAHLVEMYEGNQDLFGSQEWNRAVG